MNKIEHLKMIQEIIGRLSGFSNNIKSWMISLIAVSITLGFSLNEGNKLYFSLILSLGVTLIFMILDLYYLMLERSYRNLYETVRNVSEDNIDFKMAIESKEGTDNLLNNNTSKYQNIHVCYLKGLKSPSIWLFYIPVLVLEGIILIVI